jgi:hypothetical protein
MHGLGVGAVVMVVVFEAWVTWRLLMVVWALWLMGRMK